MDEVDRELAILFGANPRIQVKDLARKLGLSKQAVNHRLRVLTEAGVIRGTQAGISVSYLDAIPVAIQGISKAGSAMRAMDRLGESEFTRRVIVAGGGYLYVVGFLRKISDLDGYVEYVKRVGEIQDPIVGIYCLDDGLSPRYSVDGAGSRKLSNRVLSQLDLKIISSLKDDARRPVSEIANMVGVSSRTVRRHLERMISEGSMDMSIPYDGLSGGDLFLIMQIGLRNGVDKKAVGKRILARHYFDDQYIRSYSNIPNMLDWAFWTDKISDVRRAHKETSEDRDVRSTLLNFGYLESLYSTWRDDMPAVSMPSRTYRPEAR